MKAGLAGLGVWLAVTWPAPGSAMTTPFDDPVSPGMASEDLAMFSVGIGTVPSAILVPAYLYSQAETIVRLIEFDCDRDAGAFGAAGVPDCPGGNETEFSVSGNSADSDIARQAARYGLNMEIFDGLSLGLDVRALFRSGGRRLELFGSRLIDHIEPETETGENAGPFAGPPRSAFAPAAETLAILGAALAGLGLLWRRSRKSAAST